MILFVSTRVCVCVCQSKILLKQEILVIFHTHTHTHTKVKDFRLIQRHDIFYHIKVFLRKIKTHKIGTSVENEGRISAFSLSLSRWRRRSVRRKCRHVVYKSFREYPHSLPSFPSDLSQISFHVCNNGCIKYCKNAYCRHLVAKIKNSRKGRTKIAATQKKSA